MKKAEEAKGKQTFFPEKASKRKVKAHFQMQGYPEVQPLRPTALAYK